VTSKVRTRCLVRQASQACSVWRDTPPSWRPARSTARHQSQPSRPDTSAPPRSTPSSREYQGSTEVGVNHQPKHRQASPEAKPSNISRLHTQIAVPPAGFEPATPALGEPPSPPGRGSERYSELAIKRHRSPSRTTACRGFTDQAPTIGRRWPSVLELLGEGVRSSGEATKRAVLLQRLSGATPTCRTRWIIPVIHHPWYAFGRCGRGLSRLSLPSWLQRPSSERRLSSWGS